MPLLDALVSGSMFYDPSFLSAKELLGELPAMFSDMDADSFAESYHDAFKIEATALFQEITDFIRRASDLAEQPDVKGATWELVSLRLVSHGSTKPKIV